jgi:anti-sigma B factor antagonist
MTVRSFESGSLRTIALDGELDLATVDTFAAALSEAERSGAQRIVVDLAKVEFIDACGLRALLHAAYRSRSNGNRLRIRNGTGAVSRMIELTATAQMLPLVA